MELEQLQQEWREWAECGLALALGTGLYGLFKLHDFQQEHNPAYPKMLDLIFGEARHWDYPPTHG